MLEYNLKKKSKNNKIKENGNWKVCCQIQNAKRFGAQGPFRRPTWPFTSEQRGCRKLIWFQKKNIGLRGNIYPISPMRFSGIKLKQISCVSHVSQAFSAFIISTCSKKVFTTLELTTGIGGASNTQKNLCHLNPLHEI